MSYVIAGPELMTSAATDLATIGTNVSAAHMAAAVRTTSVPPAAADEVSTRIAALFSAHATSYQGIAAKAAAFNDQFVHTLNAAALSYTDIEATITAFLNDIKAFLQIPVNTANTILDALYAQFGVANVVLVLALLELPILIPFLLLTAPIWLPLLLVIGPFLLVLALA